MLDQKVFLQGIKYLKANYINWQFDINNDLMVQVWYKKFANLGTNTFMQIIEKYTEVNKYPPNSPVDILDQLKEELKKIELDPNEAWLETLRLINKYGCFCWTYDRKAFFLELEKTPALKKTIEEFETELQTHRRGDTYLPELFKKVYTINLKRQIEESSCLLLGTQTTLFLK